MKNLYFVITLSAFTALCVFGGVAWLIAENQIKQAKEATSQAAVVAGKKETDATVADMERRLKRDLAEAGQRLAITRTLGVTQQIIRAITVYTLDNDTLPAVDGWHQAVRDHEKHVRKLIRESTYYTDAEKKRSLADPPISFTDAWGNPYRMIHRKSPGSIDYDIVSNGPDGEEDTTDDIFSRGNFTPDD